MFLAGGLAPTTPAAPIRKLARAAKPSSRAAPGPSSRPASGPPAKGTRKNAGPSPEADDSDVIAIDQDEELPALTRPTRSRAEPTATTNGRAVKGKGKAKVDPPRTTKKVLAASEPMDVDAIDVVDDLHEEHDVQDVARAINATFRDSRLPTTTARPSRGEGSSKEIERLRQRAIDVRRTSPVSSNNPPDECPISGRITARRSRPTIGRIDSDTADGSGGATRTPGDATSGSGSRLAEASIYPDASLISVYLAQEALIKELTSQLAQKEPLTRAGKTSVLHLLTREAADEEKRLLEKELRWWKDVSDEKQQMLTQKDKRIAELEQIGFYSPTLTMVQTLNMYTTEKDLRFELKVEIENSKTLAAKAPRNPPPSATRARQGHGGVLGTDDPKHAEVVRFYEDLTNLLVTAMKLQPGKYLGLEEWCFTCIYTYVEDDNDSVPGVKKSAYPLHCGEPPISLYPSYLSANTCPIRAQA